MGYVPLCSFGVRVNGCFVVLNSFASAAPFCSSAFSRWLHVIKQFTKIIQRTFSFRSFFVDVVEYLLTLKLYF